jgi:hypothetical protein
LTRALLRKLRRPSSTLASCGTLTGDFNPVGGRMK